MDRQLPYIVSKQQQIIDKIANELGVIAYRPNYFGKDGDKNTVLFYTVEDNQKNMELDKSGEMIRSSDIDFMKWMGINYEGLEDKFERPYFFWFENSDINGMYDPNYANYGEFYLLFDPEKVLFEAIKEALGKYKKRGVKNE